MKEKESLIKRIIKAPQTPLYLMVIVPAVLIFIYSYLPLFGNIIAFKDFKLGLGILGSKFNGVANFRYIFGLPNSWQVIRNTVFIAFFKIVGNLAVPIVFALLLNEIRLQGYKRSIQTLIYLPYFLSWVILAGLFSEILSPSDGIVNLIIKALGGKEIYFLGNEKVFPLTMIVTDIWKNFGYGTIVYLAALSSIDPSLYESAMLDGANRWKQTLHITLPGIRGIIVLMMLLSLGDMFNAGFDQIYNLINPLVKSTGEVLDTYIYQLSIGSQLFGPATALGLAKSVISFGFVSLGYYLADKYADYKIF